MTDEQYQQARDHDRRPGGRYVGLDRDLSRKEMAGTWDQSTPAQAEDGQPVDLLGPCLAWFRAQWPGLLVGIAGGIAGGIGLMGWWS